MKKKIIVSFTIFLILLSACSSKSPLSEPLEYFEERYDEVKIEDKKGDGYNEISMEMSVDGVCFYYFHFADFRYEEDENGNAISVDQDVSLYTTFFASLYEKYKDEILIIANKYNLDISYEMKELKTVSYYDHVTQEFNNAYTYKTNNLIINADISQLDDIQNFAKEVIEIKEINKLYKFIFDREDFSYYDRLMGYDISKINIYDGDTFITSFSIVDEVYENRSSKLK